MTLNIFLVLVGLIGLYYGSDWLVRGSSKIALGLKISPLLIGLTIVAVGTSMPELVVSVISGIQGSPAIALGNVIGSNIANIGLILGVTGMISALAVHEKIVIREIPMMVMVSLFATILILDGEISQLDGILLLFGYIIFNWVFYILAKSEADVASKLTSDIEVTTDAINIRTEVIIMLVGLVVLVAGAQAMVTGAVEIARSFGVSELVIGVTMVAVGTSLPELATSVTAALKGESDIAIGNVVGSNIANLLLILGSTATIRSIDIGQTDLSIVEYLVMIGFAMLLIPLTRDRTLGRTESAIFLGAYVAFIVYSFIS